MTQELFIPGPLPGLNELIAAAKGHGGRGYGYSKIKLAWSQAVQMHARRAHLQPVDRAYFYFEWHEANKRRDPDNVVAGGRKLILDGLVEAKILPRDGWAHVAGFADTWLVESRAGVRILIESC